MRHRLLAGLRAMGLPEDERGAKLLARFHDMLLVANARTNLTRVPADISEAVDRNYLDSLAALPLLSGVRDCVDVGSGAGFPGIPLSAFLPEARFVLMDSLGKRVDFLQMAIDALGLNADAVQLRAEDAGRGGLREMFDAAISRAVAPMNVLSELLLPLVRVGGRALALKGPGAEAELRDAEGAIALLGGRVADVRTVDIPGRDWGHNIVVLEKIAPTPDNYPRRAGIPEKRPLPSGRL